MQLDTSKVKAGPDGMDGYAWPIDREMHVQAMQIMTMKHDEFVVKERHLDPSSINLLHGYLISLIASIFQAERLRHCFKYSEVPAYASYWRLVLLGEEVPTEKYLGIFTKGIPAGKIKNTLRKYKPSWLMNGLSSCGLNATHFNENIISTAGTSSLIIDHAGALKEKVYVCPLNEWFPPPLPRDLVLIHNRLVDEGYIYRYIDQVAEVFEIFGVKLSHISAKFIAQWIFSTTRFLDYYCRRIEQRPEFLPKRLWMNSIGIPWNSLLSYATRNAGGHVTVHDHALGANVAVNSHTGFVELRNSDCFVTYSDEIKSLLQTYSSNGVRRELCPKIMSIAEFGIPRFSSRVIKKPKRKPLFPAKTIMYIQPLFMGDVGQINPRMADVVAADWQIRLLKEITGYGYRVLVKPHPASRFNLPFDCFQDLGVEVLLDEFEAVYEKADVLLYDYSFTTTFGSGLRTDRHVVFIDFGYADLPAQILVKLDKRVSRLIGWFDDANRAQVEWSALKDVICSASHKNQNSFVHDVLGG